MAKDEGDDLLPDKDAAKGFYAKYEPKEILGRLEKFSFIYLFSIIRLKTNFLLDYNSSITYSLSNSSLKHTKNKSNQMRSKKIKKRKEKKKHNIT